ncbi:hypothetical protein KEM56_006627 [Ascosphaera pollenicola]|nr:hypothetical protein KEM56_006627 [Ascosphaera pollenicola]
MQNASLFESVRMAGEGESLYEAQHVSRERQDPRAHTHPPSRIPTPFHASSASGAPLRLPPNHPYSRLRRRTTPVWRRTASHLPVILRDCLEAFSARFGSFPPGVALMSRHNSLPDYIRHECECRAVTAFAFLEDIGDTSRWWRRNADGQQPPQLQAAPSNLIDDLQWRLLDSDEFTFQRLRSLRHPVLRWKICWWIERFNIQFSEPEIARLDCFLQTEHPNGVAETFVGCLPDIDATHNQNGTPLPPDNQDHEPDRRKRVKIRIGWNHVVRAWIRITDSGPDGTQEEELEYFMFPGKLRTVPPRRFKGPWTEPKIGFLFNLTQLIEKKPLKFDYHHVHAGMHEAIRERNPPALELLMTFTPPHISHFRRAMRQNDLKIFKLLIMYGGQFLPSHDTAFIAWAERLKEPHRSRRKRVFGEWLSDYLGGVSARRMALNPLFMDGELHDVDEWRENERLREVFSDMGIIVEDAGDAEDQGDHGDEDRHRGQSVPPNAIVISNNNNNRTDSRESQTASGDTNTTTRGQGGPSDSSGSARRTRGNTNNDATATSIPNVGDNVDNTERNATYLWISDGPLETANIHGFHVPLPEGRIREIRRGIPAVDGATEGSRLDTILQADPGEGYVAVWSERYNDNDADNWDPDVPSLTVHGYQW